MENEALRRIVLEYGIDVPVSGVLVEETPDGKRFFLVLYGGRRIELPGPAYLALAGDLPLGYALDPGMGSAPAPTPTLPPTPPLITDRSGEGRRNPLQGVEGEEPAEFNERHAREITRINKRSKK